VACSGAIYSGVPGVPCERRVSGAAASRRSSASRRTLATPRSSSFDGGEAGAAGLGDEEHVAGLDVAVNDAVLVRAGEGLADLGDDRHHLLPGDRAGLAVDPLAEGLALEQLHDEVDEAVVAAEVGDIDELRVADPGGAEGLLAEAGDVVLDMRKLRV
jgi:hypothetical protein